MTGGNYILCGNFHKMNLDAGDDVFQYLGSDGFGGKFMNACFLGVVEIVVNGDQNGSPQFKAILICLNN